MDEDFRKRFNLGPEPIEKLQGYFINRINTNIFDWLENSYDFLSIGYNSNNFVKWISSESGEPWDKKFLQNHEGDYFNVSLSKIARNDFYNTLWLVGKCYQFIKEGRMIESRKMFITDNNRIITLPDYSQRVEETILLSHPDIGIFWKDGIFYKAGAKELDNALVKENLIWLDNYPDTKKLFDTALKHFKESFENKAARKDAITNAYSAIEGLVRSILVNNNTFEKNSDILVDKLRLSKEYKNIVYNYKQIAHNYSSRHAGGLEFSNAEAEAFIYLTGLLMRLISHLSDNK